MAKAKTGTKAFIDFFTPKGKTSGALPSSAKMSDYDTAMSKYLSNERLSAAETTVLGLNHPAGGGVNLSRLPSEYTAEFDMQRKLKPRKIITPESMFGSASIPLVGDSADAGKRLISVNGIPLNEDVNLQGGSRFGRDNKDAWASGQGVVTVLDNQIERALQGVDKVYAPHVSMSGTGGDFNTMTTKTLLNLFDPADISPESAKKFDDSIKSTQKKNKKTGEITYPFADFVGVQHPELREQLLSKLEGTGNLRKAFVETMNKAEFQKLGFPEPAAARFATSDRDLLDKPIGSTGYEIMQFAPGERVITKPKVPHETYPVHLKGDYAGSLADTVPAEVFFKDYYEGRRLMGSPKSSDTRAFTMSSPIQYHDQAWLDNIMGFITARDKKIKTGEYAEGGMVETPAQEAIADTVQNPNAARMLDMDLANLAVMNQQPQRMAAGGASKMLRVMHGSPTKIKTTNDRPLHVTTDPLYATKRGSDKLDQMGMEGPPMVNRYDIPEDKLLRMDETMYSPETINLMRRYWNRIPADTAMTGEEIYDLLSANKQPFDRLLPGISQAGGFLGYQRPATGTGGRDEWFKIMRPESLEVVKKKGGAVKRPSTEEMRIEMMERGYGKR
jgi:hypothetical protein